MVPRAFTYAQCIKKFVVPHYQHGAGKVGHTVVCQNLYGRVLHQALLYQRRNERVK